MKRILLLGVLSILAGCEHSQYVADKGGDALAAIHKRYCEASQDGRALVRKEYEEALARNNMPADEYSAKLTCPGDTP